MGVGTARKFGQWLKGWIQRAAGNPTSWATWYADRDRMHQARAKKEMAAADHCRRRARQFTAKAEREGGE